MKVINAVIAACIGGAFFAHTLVSAQDFPEKAITIVVPFAPGGSDLAVRAVAAKMAANLKEPVIVDNKPGGGGIIASEIVKRAPADGYTLLLGTMGSHAINQSLYTKLPYDPVKDFVPVTNLVSTKHVLVVPIDSPANSLADLVALAQKKPGGLTFASPSVGTGSHLLGEILKTKSGGTLTHVPYRGAAPALQDLLAGRVDMIFDAVVVSTPFIKSGKLKAIAVASKTRFAGLPQVPTTAEAGYPELDMDFWFGIFAPAGTPRAVIAKLNSEIHKGLMDPQVTSSLGAIGWDLVPSTPAAFGALVTADSVRLGKVVRDSGAKVD